jgi:hypothetical protein
MLQGVKPKSSVYGGVGRSEDSKNSAFFVKFVKN